LTLQSSTQTSVDAEGQPVISWSDFATVSGRAEYLEGRELELMQKVNSEITVRFTVRYNTTITALMRVSWRSALWNIHAVLPWESQDFMYLGVSKVE